MCVTIRKAGLAIPVGIFVLSHGGHCLRFQACWTALRVNGFLHWLCWIDSFSTQARLPAAACGIFTIHLLWSQWPFIFSPFWLFLFTTPTSQYWSAAVLRPRLFSVDFLSMNLSISVHYFLFHIFSPYLSPWLQIHMSTYLYMYLVIWIVPQWSLDWFLSGSSNLSRPKQNWFLLPNLGVFHISKDHSVLVVQVRNLGVVSGFFSVLC